MQISEASNLKLIMNMIIHGMSGHLFEILNGIWQGATKESV